MPKKVFTTQEIRRVTRLMRALCRTHLELRSADPLAKHIQFPKIPSGLSESLVIHLIRRQRIFSDLVDIVRVDLSSTRGDIDLVRDGGKSLSVEVKATGRQAFQLLYEKDLNSDHLVWVHFDDYFQNESRYDIQLTRLDNPRRVFRKPNRKITLRTFLKESEGSDSTESVDLTSILDLSGTEDPQESTRAPRHTRSNRLERR